LHLVALQVDYRGQQFCEQLFQWIIISFGVGFSSSNDRRLCLTLCAQAVGWVVGYFKQDFQYCFNFWAVGTAIALVVCMPPPVRGPLAAMGFLTRLRLSRSGLYPGLALLQQRSDQVAAQYG
jgi:hypothetical protein